MSPKGAAVPPSKASGLLLSILVGGILLLTSAGLGACLIPAVTCPKCNGKGLHRMIDPEGPPRWRGVIYQPLTCDFCSDRRPGSLVKQGRWSPQEAPTSPIYRN
jgi:hypothetical protein